MDSDHALRCSPCLAACVLAACAVLAAGCDRQEPEAQPTVAETRVGAARPEPEPPLKYSLVDTFASGMKGLKGIAVDAEGRVCLAGEEGIRVLSAEGEELSAWRTSAPARCVAAGFGGDLYVGLRTRVERYDGAGNLLAAWGKEGKGRGEFSVITGIAVSGPDVFVADAGNRCIHRFGLTGDFIDEIGKRDAEAGTLGLVCPSASLGCRVDAEGILHVGNPGLQRVERYAPDGELLGFWGEAGIEPKMFSGCCNPINIELMPGGRTVTAEKDIPRVKVYDGGGKMLAFIGPEFFSSGAPGLDVAVDSDERIYVVDPVDGKVRVFAAQD